MTSRYFADGTFLIVAFQMFYAIQIFWYLFAFTFEYGETCFFLDLLLIWNQSERSLSTCFMIFLSLSGDTKTLVSSANHQILTFLLVIFTISFVHIRNKSGLKTGPCGTP